MLRGTEPAASQAGAVFPGLEHLHDKVGNWDAALRTLAFTASALADSVGAASPMRRTCPASYSDERSESNGATSAPSAATALPYSLPALALSLPPPSTMFISAAQLKPGRLFIVANLQGAYYTLVELLSRHKFDFRQDNLLHLGNLVAPPTNTAETGSTSSSSSPAATATTVSAVTTPGGPGAVRRCRNSAPLLKLIRRHCGGTGAGGPMGTNECLELLAAARANCQRALEEQEERKRLAWQQQQQQRPGGSGAAATSCRRGALSLQLAAAAAAAGGSAPVVTPTAAAVAAAAPVMPPRPATLSRRMSRFDVDNAGSGDPSSSDGDDDSSEEGEEELVTAPLTPCREEPSPSLTKPAYATKPSAAAIGGLDDADLALLLSMPACLVVEPYGILLQHAGPPASAASGSGGGAGVGTIGRYHTFFSHRRAAGGGAAGGVVPASSGPYVTGLASCRDVVRCAILPPLRTLQRRSLGFVAKSGAGVAASRDELLMDVVAEPISDLDLVP